MNPQSSFFRPVHHHSAPLHESSTSAAVVFDVEEVDGFDSDESLNEARDSETEEVELIDFSSDSGDEYWPTADEDSSCDE